MTSVITGTKQRMGEAYLGNTRRAVTLITLHSQPDEPLAPGTICNIQGKSKGKGFAGVVKRWNFAGGFKTHGQSDRHRAPGSIGQGTTPGRVHKGKKMAGRMGNQTHTVKNSLVVSVSDNDVWVTGPVPGNKGSSLNLKVTGQVDAPSVTFLTGGLPITPEPQSAPPAPDTSSSPSDPSEEPSSEETTAKKDTQELAQQST